MNSQLFYRLYREYFVSGYQDYNNQKQLEVIEDLSKISTIAYIDGYKFAENCMITHRTLGMSDENFNANLNIYYNRALDKQKEYHDLYVEYANGFFVGWEDVNLKIKKQDDDFNLIPDIEEKNSYSIGYHDGYCYYLNYYLNRDDSIEEIEEEITPEIVVRESFQKKYPSTNLDLEKCKSM